MKICIEQMLGELHSWAQTTHNVARNFIKKGHEVHLKSTNGYRYFPEDLKPYIKENLNNSYDLQLSYTAPINFPKYLSHGNTCRYGIWNYETTVLPPGFAKYYKAIDYLLPSSNFSKDIFLRNGIPENKLKMIPHGIDTAPFLNKSKYKLKTSKAFKVLANVAQPHIRKNLPGLLEAYGRAFKRHDDVCLVMKVVVKKPEHPFEVSFTEFFEKFKKQFPNHAEVEIISNFIPDISELYRACDIVFSTTNAECFWLPGLEGFAAEKIVISSNYGGQLDYMNSENSLLIEGKIVQAPKNSQYWAASPYAEMFEPNVDDAANKLFYAVSNYNLLIEKYMSSMREKVNHYSWGSVSDQILNLSS